MAGGASRTARLQYLSAPESGGRQPRNRHDVDDPLLLAHQRADQQPPLGAGHSVAAATVSAVGRQMAKSQAAFMQADSSSETLRKGWIWRLHGAMNGMRTASRDFRVPGWNTHETHGLESWNVVFLCTRRTKHVWYPMSTILSFVPNQRRLRNSGC